jgi:mono/diheme cytochrome c family protein
MIKSISSVSIWMIFTILGTFPTFAAPSTPTESGLPAVPTGSANGGAAADPLATKLGVEFLPGSTSSVILDRGGRRYLVDLATHRVSELAEPAEAHLARPQGEKATPAQQSDAAKIFKEKCAGCHGSDGEGIASIKTPDFTNETVQASLSDAEMLNTIKNGRPGTMMPAWGDKLSEQDMDSVARFIRSFATPATASAGQTKRRKPYQPGDDVLMTLPTGRRLDRHGLYLNFAHRFPFDPAFSGTARGGAMLGLDGFALPSFGLRYGVTDKLSVSIFRSPTYIGRPIQIGAAYNFLDEHDGQPFNFAARFSMEGEDNFAKNFTEDFEAIFSRSISSRAQLYLVPTVALNDRPLQQVFAYEASAIADVPGHNTFSLGAGGALDVRPTVALIAEVIPTLVNGRPLGIHRPAFSFGVQKKIWRHSFTFGFTNSPGTTVSQRAGTDASFLGDPSADTPKKVFIGFDISRQLF